MGGAEFGVLAPVFHGDRQLDTTSSCPAIWANTITSLQWLRPKVSPSDGPKRFPAARAHGRPRNPLPKRAVVGNRTRETICLAANQHAVTVDSCAQGGACDVKISVLYAKPV